MEKFGIFELLDTLSAITAPLSEIESAETEQTEAKAQPERANPQDSAFSPPAFGAPPLSENEPAPEKKSGNAFTALLQRHDSISKKIDGKK